MLLCGHRRLPVMQARTRAVLSPLQGLGQCSRIQPMSERLLFHGDLSHEPSHRRSCSHMFPLSNGMPGHCLKHQLLESPFLPEFSAFPALPLVSVHPYTRGLLHSRKQKLPPGHPGLCFLKHKSMRTMWGVCREKRKNHILSKKQEISEDS